MLTNEIMRSRISDRVKRLRLGPDDKIEINVRDSVAFLAGSVSEPSLKADAGRAALSVKGIEACSNSIQVISSGNEGRSFEPLPPIEMLYRNFF